jgi:hypothetical protein
MFPISERADPEPIKYTITAFRVADGVVTSGDCEHSGAIQGLTFQSDKLDLFNK